MDDLKLIIEYLEAKRQEFLPFAENRYGEPDFVYNNESLKYINQQLAFFKKFREEYNESLLLEAELEKLKYKSKAERRTLMTKLFNAIDKNTDEDLLKSKLTDQIKIHSKRISKLKSDIANTQAKINSLSSEWEATHKQDLIYELTEAVYDDRLEKYELGFPNYYKNFRLLVKGDEHFITITFIPLEESPYKHVFSSAQEGLMTKMNYKLSEGIWSYNFDRNNDHFDKLITTIARTLVELCGLLEGEIVVKYEDYE